MKLSHILILISWPTFLRVPRCTARSEVFSLAIGDLPLDRVSVDPPRREIPPAFVLSHVLQNFRVAPEGADITAISWLF